MSVLKIDKNNYDEIIVCEKPVLIDFYAEWCGPCRMVGPIIEEIARENEQYLIAKINVDQSPELAMQFGIVSIPTLIVMKGGEVVQQVAGARPKAQILSMLDC